MGGYWLQHMQRVLSLALPPSQAVVSNLQPMRKPPTQLLKEAFDKHKGKPPSGDKCSTVARNCLLKEEEVAMWSEHLATVQRNQKQGAEKAAATWRQRKQPSNQSELETDCSCSICGEEYEDETDEIQNWIACDHCVLVSFLVCWSRIRKCTW